MAQIHHPSGVSVPLFVTDSEKTKNAALPTTPVTEDALIEENTQRKIVTVYQLLTVTTSVAFLLALPLMVNYYLIQDNFLIIFGPSLIGAAIIYVKILKSSRIHYGLTSGGCTALGLACWSVEVALLSCAIRTVIIRSNIDPYLLDLHPPASFAAMALLRRVSAVNKMPHCCRFLVTCVVSTLVSAGIIALLILFFKENFEIVIGFVFNLIFQAYVAANVELIIRKNGELSSVGVVHQLFLEAPFAVTRIFEYFRLNPSQIDQAALSAGQPTTSVNLPY